MKQILFLVIFLRAFAVDCTFAKSISEIHCARGKEILVSSFMTAYEDVPLADLNPDFRSTGDVRRFYENYFDSELEEYKEGHLVWVQAFSENDLLGWATFEIVNEDTAYMNLLVVDPKYQNQGIGKKLVFSIQEEFPNIKTIDVFVRKVNIDGENFYRKIGFSDFPICRDDNFVDVNLLSGFRWTMNPF